MTFTHAQVLGLQWLPRILGLLAVVFVSLFALDAFEPGVPFLRQIAAFLIHMIPSFVLAALIVLAWKQELIGGTVLAIIGFVFTLFVLQVNYARTDNFWLSAGLALMVAFPFVLTGLLFIASYYAKKNERR